MMPKAGLESIVTRECEYRGPGGWDSRRRLEDFGPLRASTSLLANEECPVLLAHAAN